VFFFFFFFLFDFNSEEQRVIKFIPKVDYSWKKSTLQYFITHLLGTTENQQETLPTSIISQDLDPHSCQLSRRSTHRCAEH